ncbi:t-SNARE [Syncephalis fuscata]|nr:t-SNARE [Syncephalis fuscata]
MRDRLQELQPERGAAIGDHGPAMEMGQMSGQSSMDQFFQEIQYIQDSLGQIQTSVARIEELHQQSLNELSLNVYSKRLIELSQEMDYHVSETRKLMMEIKGRIKAIEIANQKVPSSSGDLQIRKSQCAQLKRKFLDAVQRYQQVEQQFRQKYRERMERQYRIVCPNATQAEVDAALDSNTGNQLFAQELLQSTRHGEAKRALREVQERHEDIRRIEQTILELHTLFQEMQTLVESQGQMIDSIENNVTNAANYTETAVKHIDTAIVHRKSARKRMWCLITLLLILIIIIIVVVYVYVILPSKQAFNAASPDSTGTSSTPAASSQTPTPT